MEHNEIIVVEVEFYTSNKYALIVAYRSQQDLYPLLSHKFATVLDNCIRANLTNNILVMGDFNYINITWDTAWDTKLPPHCTDYMDNIQTWGLSKSQSFYGRKS